MVSRTAIDIEDEIFKKAQALTSITKKVDIVNHALR